MENLFFEISMMYQVSPFTLKLFHNFTLNIDLIGIWSFNENVFVLNSLF